MEGWPAPPLSEGERTTVGSDGTGEVGANVPEDVDGDGVPDPIAAFTLPSYALVDAGLSYRFGPWGVRLNVNNLFDKRYFPDACCVDRVTPGEPRNWRLSLTRSF